MEFEERSDNAMPCDTFTAHIASETGGGKSSDCQSDEPDSFLDGGAQNDNAGLWELVSRLRSVQKRTWEKYSSADLERIDLRERLRMKEEELRLVTRRWEDGLELDTNSKEKDR